jgi:hypothetical protein
MKSKRALLALLLAAGACAPDAERAEAAADDAHPGVVHASPQDAFWHGLQALCESAHEGALLRAPEDDTQLRDARLVVHFRECGDDELRFPLHVDDDRSRTWVFIRHDDRLELRHDHRHQDGTEEDNTWYGAFTLAEGTANRQEFLTERDGMLRGWRVEHERGESFTYGTVRDGGWRHHLEFDLTREVPAPPPPWGYETRPSQRP